MLQSEKSKENRLKCLLGDCAAFLIILVVLPLLNIYLFSSMINEKYFCVNCAKKISKVLVDVSGPILSNIGVATVTPTISVRDSYNATANFRVVLKSKFATYSSNTTNSKVSSDLYKNGVESLNHSSEIGKLEPDKKYHQNIKNANGNIEWESQNEGITLWKFRTYSLNVDLKQVSLVKVCHFDFIIH